jgi:UDP-glucuronate 4-epimerase
MVPVKRWLVSGGVGFIGHHLVRHLVARGDHVRIIDDFSAAPYPTRFKRRNANELASSSPNVEINEGSVEDPSLVSSLVHGVDGVLHLAGLAGVRPSFVEPALYQRVNVEGTAVMLDAAQKAGVELFVLASSSSVYGNATPLPAKEESPAVAPESPYAASKRGAELVTSAMLRKTPKMRCACLRFFTVYGPRQRPEMAISMWLRKILRGEPITVFGDGSMRRDFTHVDDIVRGVITATEKAPVGYREYNLGSGSPITLTDLVRAMERASGKKPIVEHAPVPLGDVDATFADISRVKSELGWEPRVKIEDGLATVVDWLGREPD